MRSAGPILVAGALITMCCAPGCGTIGGGDQSANAAPVAHLQTAPPDPDHLMARAKAAPADKVLTMELEFALRNQAQLDQIMAQIQDPHSPRYQQWLTPEEVHAQFGESQANFDAVLGWVKAQGFNIIDQSYGGNEDYIRFTGTVAQADKAFQVEIMEPAFQLYAPKEGPVIPPQFAGIIARINGLDNLGFQSSQ